MEKLTQKDHADRREQELFELQGLGYGLDWKSEYHCRVNGLLDIWPSSGKYHDLRDNTRGQIIGSVVSFIKDNVELNERR